MGRQWCSWRKRFGALVLWALAGGIAFARPVPPNLVVNPSTAPVLMSAAAAHIYAATRTSLLQVRTLVDAAGRAISYGSGFLVSEDGLAITNYHVVSQYALDPKTYHLEFARPDGTHGALILIAVDVADDLAVVRLEGAHLPHLDFDPAAANLQLGESVYSMGNPLNRGFTIVDGSYSGFVERSYNRRLRFTGALNPGMSGGPTVSDGGQVVGINEAVVTDGQLTSVLVPASKAVALLARVRTSAPLAFAQMRGAIDHQMLAWQSGFYKAVESHGFRSATFGPYVAPESAAPWFDCWAQTNIEQTPKPRAQMDSSVCESKNWLPIAEDLQIGRVELTHIYLRNGDLNAFQFAAFVSRYYDSASLASLGALKRMTQPECREGFVAPSDVARAPVLRVMWCARAYRDFAGIYDVMLTTVTQDKGRAALVSRLTLQGVSYDNAMGLSKRVMGAIAWKK
ncbi:MAG: serine protease [Rhodanobacter sp.]